MKKLMLFLLLAVFIFAPLIAGCSSDDAPAAQEEPEVAEEPEAPEAEEPVAEEPVAEAEEEDDPEPETGDENGAGDDDDVLFTFFETPSDWTYAVPVIMRDANATSYERTDNTLYVAGYVEIPISRVSNYYMNARKEVGTSFDWEFDPTKDSVTEGDDQVFYYIDDAGKTLTIRLKEVEENWVEFELDFKE